MYLPPTGAPAAPASIGPTEARLKQAAVALEAGFLAEMLKFADLGSSPKGFGGGAGEDQFSSFLVRAQAEHFARSGGIGLAESLYHALKETTDER